MWIDSFGSRRKGRVWVQRNWPGHGFVKLRWNAKVPAEALAWAKERDVYFDNNHRRWWFKSKDDALLFKLKYGGKND